MSALDVDTVLGWRGQTVVTNDGEELGTLHDVFLDAEDRPGWGAVRSGLLGRHRRFVPLYAAQGDGDAVRVPYSREQVEGAPDVDPDVHLEGTDEWRLYQHYGLSGDAHDDGPSDAMTRSEEEVRTATTPMQPRERVRIRKVLVTENVKQTVPVQKEVVALEHDPPPDASLR